MKLKPVALSLSQAEIDEIATELLEATQLDWSRAITSITLSQFPYTASEDGVLFMQPQITEPGTANRRTVYVNNIAINEVIPSVTISGTDYRRPSDLYIPLKKGDVVSFSSTQYLELRATSVFVPFKTMNPVSLRPLDPHKIDTAILNHWDDITSDFSIPGSASGFVLQSVKYNSVLQQLKIIVKKTTSSAASTTFKLYLQYNGSDSIHFGDSTAVLWNHFGPANGYLAGMEYGMAVMAANKLEIDTYNRNSSNAWAANDTFRGIIWL